VPVKNNVHRKYKEIETGIPGEEIAFPSSQKMKKTFDDWLYKMSESLYKLICIDWDYPSKRKSKEFRDSIALIIAIADYIISCSIQIPTPIAVVTILFLKDLDNFCDKSDKIRSAR
jgi:hypothetical protein